LKDKGTLEFSFYREDQYFLTIHRKLNEYNSDRDFLEEIPLGKFEPGVYSLKVSLREQGGEEVLSQREELTILTKPFPGAWVVAQTNPSTDDPYYSYIMGVQFLNKGDIQKAHKELAKAHERKPGDIDYALSYARVLLTLKNYPRVREILIPFVKTGKENFGLFYSLGSASQEMSEFKEAISYYENALRLKGPITLILNAIGECYLQLGETGQALKAFEKSLETDPSQESIRRKIENLKKNTNTD
jgi:tetratricopeptide (TPR) repeat protein